MARSRRKSPFCGFCVVRSGDEKWYKTNCNRRMRHGLKLELHRWWDYENLTHTPNKKEWSDAYMWPKDGKLRIDMNTDWGPRLMRK